MRSAWSACSRSLAANLAGRRTRRRCWPAPARDAVHLLVVATSDRGLAGGFNATILREARRTIRELHSARQDGQDPDHRPQGARRAAPRPRRADRREPDRYRPAARSPSPRPQDIAAARSSRASRPASSTAHHHLQPLPVGDHQIVTRQQLIPFAPPSADAAPRRDRGRDLRVRARRGGDPDGSAAAQSGGADLPRAAGERGERAGRAHDRDGQRDPQCRRDDRPARPSPTTARARPSITKELIEIISGAEAL